jgi:outer membrane lipoprotein carrier protein
MGRPIFILRTLAGALCTLAFVGAPLGQAASPVDDLVDHVETACAKVEDLSAQFQQTATNRTLGEVREASGIFSAKRPNQMRWEYQKPEERLFVTNGKTLWAYSPAEKQVIVQDIAQALNARLPLAFLAGDCHLRKEFDVTLVENAATRAGTTRILDLRPKRPEAGIARMLLEINPKSYTVEKVAVFDAYQNTTVIGLSNLRLNTGLSDDRFQFTPPPGVRVVTPGKP